MTDTIKTIHTPKTNFFNTKEDHVKFITFWKALATSKKASCEDHILYTILKGNDLKKAFSPITNQTKLTCNLNGNKYHNIAAAYYRTNLAFTSKSALLYKYINADWYAALNDDTKAKLVLFFADPAHEFEKMFGE